MLTLDQAVEQQNNLEILCRDRPLVTDEIFDGNAFYGMASIIKQYCDLREDYPLKVIIPHGVFLDVNLLWDAERHFPLPVVLCYPENRQAIYKKRTNKQVHLFPSPFIYLLELNKEQIKPERKGTLFFPHHSTHHVTTEMDFDLLAEKLINLADKYQPVTVCIYWKDYNLGHHKPFEKHGLKIVSAGHIYDNNFLYRFYHLCSLHKYSSGNGVGSQIFYSIKAGCSYFHFDVINYTSYADDAHKKMDIPNIPVDFLVNLKNSFGIGNVPQPAMQEAFSDYYLGAKYFLSKEKLKHLLIQAEILDLVRFICYKEKKMIFFVPTRLKRNPYLQELKHKINNLQGKD